MAQVEDIQKLITINNRRLQVLKEQKAFGGALADPKYEIEIEAIEAELQNLGTELEKAEKSRQAEPRNIEAMEAKLRELQTRLTELELKRIPFVNRESEIDQILSPYAPAYYLLDAPAGYGKTELLKELARRFTDQNWLCAYVSIKDGDSRKDEPTLADLIIPLAEKLGVTSRIASNDDFPWSLRFGVALRKQWEEVTNESKKQGASDPKKGLVLLMDLDKKPSIKLLPEILEDFIPDIQRTLRDLRFFDGEQNRFRVILAGRHLASQPAIRTSPLPLAILRLSPFNYEIIRDTTRKYFPGQVEPSINKLSAHLFYLTGGHPGCIAQILKVYEDKPLTPDLLLLSFDSANEKKSVQEIVADIRDGISQSFPGLHQVLDKLSVFRYMDYFILEKMLKYLELDRWEEYELADQLTATYLLDWKGRVLRDDITRRLLAINLRNEDPDTFSKLCEVAKKLCETRLRQPSVQRPEIWMIEYLFQSLQGSANAILEPEERRLLREQFFKKDVPEALRVYLEGRKITQESWHIEQKALNQAIEEDWEFCFTVNYYLRKDTYTNEPYNELSQHINDYFGQK